jgi:hypothetical protein
MELPELRDIMPLETLGLVIDGTTYVVEPAMGAAHRKMSDILQQLRTAEPDTLLEITTDELQELTLGPARQQMIQGQVRYPEMTRSAWTAFYWHLELEEVARDVWRGTPEPAPAKAATRSRKKTGSKA